MTKAAWLGSACARWFLPLSTVDLTLAHPNVWQAGSETPALRSYAGISSCTLPAYSPRRSANLSSASLSACTIRSRSRTSRSFRRCRLVASPAASRSAPAKMRVPATVTQTVDPGRNSTDAMAVFVAAQRRTRDGSDSLGTGTCLVRGWVLEESQLQRTPVHAARPSAATEERRSLIVGPSAAWTFASSATIRADVPGPEPFRPGTPDRRGGSSANRSAFCRSAAFSGPSTSRSRAGSRWSGTSTARARRSRSNAPRRLDLQTAHRRMRLHGPEAGAVAVSSRGCRRDRGAGDLAHHLFVERRHGVRTVDEELEGSGAGQRPVSSSSMIAGVWWGPTIIEASTLMPCWRIPERVRYRAAVLLGVSERVPS